MNKKKPFTNTTFSKRVDHDGGRHRQAPTLSEPTACKECGAVYANRRWTIGNSKSEDKTDPHWRPALATICPACKQIRSGEPRGFVFLDGAFLATHQEEIELLVRNEAERALEDNPLARIIDLKTGGRHKLTITTTTEHLAQRLGHAIEKAFAGSIQYDFSHENKLARVSWQRD